MKTLKLSIVVLCISFMACGSNSPSTALCTATFNEEFQDELEDVTNAASAYGQNPTPENCQAFKNAYLDYIDALEGWENCATINGSLAEYNQALDDARDSANDIEC